MQFLDMLIIAPCSSKKAVAVPSRLNARTLSAATTDKYAQRWVARVRAEKKKFHRDSVYVGLGISTAQSATELLGGALYIVSAGLSVVAPTDRIPGYDLTVGDTGPRPFDGIIESAGSSDWWQSLNRALGTVEPLAGLVRQHDSRVLIALPQSYLSMVSHELLSLNQSERKKVRIITTSQTVLKPELAEIAIRYDQRLNNLASAPRGANASFVQRSLLHFARLQVEHSRISAVASQQELVDKALARASPLPAVQREKVSDAALLTIIQEALGTKSMSKTALLNFVRSKNIACEQERCWKIYDQVLTTRT